MVYRVDHGFKWFIFLTNWSYTFLNIHFILGTFLPAYYHYMYNKRKIVSCDANANEQPKGDEMVEINLDNANPLSDKPELALRHPRMLIIACKVSWVVHNIAANIAPLVTLIYWAFVYVPGQYADGSNINAHAINSVLIAIDVLLSSTPFRVFHLVYPVLYSLIYSLFTVIYWAAGGTNEEGQSYIYAIMNYEKNAGLAVLMAVMFVLLAVPLSQFLLYGLFRFRMWLVEKKTK